MSKNNKIFQQKWNEVLLAHAPESVSLAKEISDLLDISLDSAYRRLRNQTDYTLDEAAIIANHFNLPLEALNNERHSVVSFRTNQLTSDSSTYQEYLQNMSSNIRRVSGFENPEVYFGAEDIPVYYHYGSEHLMKFKVVYWLKSLLIVPQFQNQSFENIDVPPEILELASSIYKDFTKVNTTEVWTSETVLSTLKQIKFYWDAGFFDQIDTANAIIDDLEKIIKNIQRQAETGQMIQVNGSMSAAKYKLFISDVMVGTNSILVKAGTFRASYISYNTFNFMSTVNEDFNIQNEMWMDNLISRSTLISQVSEKQRNQFFKHIYKQIAELKQYILDNN